VLRDLLLRLTEFTVPIIDLLAFIFIAFGTAQAFVSVIVVVCRRANYDGSAMRLTWLRYSRWLVAGLTFQLAADILETSTTPTWNDVGQLAAIAVIRTFLNYFLERDLSEAREREQGEGMTKY
jgi:uncharacterized membrane protein